MESTASELRIWELGWIPGLFQTEGYARAVFAVFAVFGVEDVEDGIRARLNRQACLRRKPRPRVWVLLDQGVLEQLVGSVEVTRDQLAHLVEAAQWPHVTIRIVPSTVGAHVGRDGSFKIMTGNGADVVYVGAHGGGRLVQDATDIPSYRIWFDLLGDVALPKDPSLRLLREVLERFS